jgi:hypothetical protein
MLCTSFAEQVDQKWSAVQCLKGIVASSVVASLICRRQRREAERAAQRELEAAGVQWLVPLLCAKPSHVRPSYVCVQRFEGCRANGGMQVASGHI